MITKEEIISILNKYSFGELSSSIEQIVDGWTNSIYKFQIKSNEKFFILREYLPTTERIVLLEEIQYELNFISFLFKQYHLPVVPMIDPPGIFSLNNGNYCAIFPFIDGIKYVNTSEKPLRELWQIIEVSRFIGRMHSIDYPEFNRRTINLPDTKYQLINSCENFQQEYPDLYKRIRKIIDEKTDLIPLIEDELEQIKFEKHFEKNLPKGFIHVDIHDDNVLFCRNQNKIAAVLDFDDMSFGPFLIDIAMSLCCWCLYGSKLNIDCVKEYLIEYQNARNMLLTDDEWNLLELYCYMGTLHQVLFTIHSQDTGRIIDGMINELLLSIENIAQDSMFLKKIR